MSTESAARWARVHIEGDNNPPLPVIRSAGEPIRYPLPPLRALRLVSRARAGGVA